MLKILISSWKELTLNLQVWIKQGHHCTALWKVEFHSLPGHETRATMNYDVRCARINIRPSHQRRRIRWMSSTFCCLLLKLKLVLSGWYGRGPRRRNPSDGRDGFSCRKGKNTNIGREICSGRIPIRDCWIMRRTAPPIPSESYYSLGFFSFFLLFFRSFFRSTFLSCQFLFLFLC